MDGKLYLGTCGWDYPEWRGSYYPDKLPKTQRLTFVAQNQNAVEIDSTFYGLPSFALTSKWALKTPDSFVFCPKMTGIITHDAGLRGCKAEVDQFNHAVTGFGSKLGVVVIQFPHYFSASHGDAFREFLTWLDPHVRYAVEWRHRSWFTDSWLDLLRERNMALVYSDRFAERTRTASFAYFRLLGDRALIPTIGFFQVDRGPQIVELAERVQEVMMEGDDAYVFVNNHAEGHGQYTLRRLSRYMGLPQPVLLFEPDIPILTK